jgi:hypothetical protein
MPGPWWRRYRRPAVAGEAARCSWCGWEHAPTRRLYGQGTPRHSPTCAAQLWPDLTEEGLGDELAALAAWQAVASDVPGSDRLALTLAQELVAWADHLGVPLPVPDDCSALDPRARGRW